MKNLVKFVLSMLIVAFLGNPMSAQDNWATKNEAIAAHKTGVFGYYIPSISHDKMFIESTEEPYQLLCDYVIKLTVPDRLGGVRWIIRQKNGWMIQNKATSLIVRDSRCNNKVHEAEPIETEKVATPLPVIPPSPPTPVVQLGPPTPVVPSNIPPPPPIAPTRQEILKENIGPVIQKSWVRRHPVLTAIGVGLLVYAVVPKHSSSSRKKGDGGTL